MSEYIRNFCIIAHIDHGKSTLADRLLEATGTIEKRKMKNQYLDQLELERERGITIKMAPVRMMYKKNHVEIPSTKSEIRNNLEIRNSNLGFVGSKEIYILNLIDTPGHPDFGYEVSRALEAVEGALLLVDATQGIQAQTLSNFYAAQKAHLVIIPVINKVDLPTARIEETLAETMALTNVHESDILRISGKTGEGVDALLERIVSLIPPPQKSEFPDIHRALIFDSFYDDHKGIIAVVRVIDGTFQIGDAIHLIAAQEHVRIKEVGYFLPRATSTTHLKKGEVGYIVTGIKDTHKIKIGDTVLHTKDKSERKKIDTLQLPGYKEPNPVVFVSFFPNEAHEYEHLKKALERLRLNDSAFSFEPDFNEVLGRGFKGGFLGKLHFEIVAQRLEREFGMETVTSFPSVAYKVRTRTPLSGAIQKDEHGYALIQNPKDLPSEVEEIWEPYIAMEIVCPHALFGSILQLKEKFRWQAVHTTQLGDRIIIHTRMPLAELISDFDDTLKSISGGYASFSYKEDGYEKDQLERLDILVASQQVPGLSRILPKKNLVYESRKMVRLLKDTLPRQQFAQAVQAYAHGQILARETIPALRKDVTGYLYGGDRTRKMKLWKKQKEGKKKLLSMARVKISPQDFKKLLAK